MLHVGYSPPHSFFVACENNNSDCPTVFPSTPAIFGFCSNARFIFSSQSSATRQSSSVNATISPRLFLIPAFLLASGQRDGIEKKEKFFRVFENRSGLQNDSGSAFSFCPTQTTSNLVLGYVCRSKANRFFSNSERRV